jgi:hypothetical protein
MSNTVMIPRASLRLATDGTNSSENKCSHLSLDRHAGVSLSLAEMRTQVHSRIFESVAHIRMLLALEAGV